MRIAISSQEPNDQAVKSVRAFLEGHGISSYLLGNKTAVKDTDYVIVTGGDKGVRHYFHNVLDSETPVLGINESESSGFLAQIDLKEFSSFVKRLKSGDFAVEKITRIGIKIDGKNVYPALNDVAIF